MNKKTIIITLLALVATVGQAKTYKTIIGPIAEELFLRKWYISVMERASFGKIAIVVSNALIFYAAHVGTGIWRLDTLIMAVILCLIYMKTRDVRYCVITHVTCNLLGIFSAYYFV